VGAVIGVLAAVGGLVIVGAADLGWGALLMLALSSAAGVLTGIVAGGVAVAALAKGERSIIVLGPLVFGTVCLCSRSACSSRRRAERRGRRRRLASSTSRESGRDGLAASDDVRQIAPPRIAPASGPTM
jgi:hypothetical protein